MLEILQFLQIATMSYSGHLLAGPPLMDRLKGRDETIPGSPGWELDRD